MDVKIKYFSKTQSIFVLHLSMISKGIFFILIATFAFAIMNATAKELSNFHPMQVVFFRAIGTFIFIFPTMLIRKIPIIGNNPKLLFLRGLVGVVSLSTFFMALQKIPLGSAISIRYLGPIFGVVMAAYFLKEKVKGIQWLSLIIAFSGVIVLKGFDPRIDSASLGLLLISALFVGMVFVMIRYLTDKEHYLTIINYFMVVTIIVSLFFVNLWRIPIKNEWYSVVGIGILGLIGQVFMTRAFQTEDTSVLAPFKYMELVWALILGYFLFDETYSWAPFFGISLIIIGMLLNVYSKNKTYKE
ncbi:MAG: DMT family transporter [Saprospiraceae bacterium]|nr:DMT family transporter [Saprospiraceae bacterium]MDG1434365.1 DMT family transporter [Saprospiraceae bacterium]MDG2418947.1 DMT family transporter [Saprospiraceae bacterium]